MYKTFTLKTVKGEGDIIAYHWELEDPRKVVLLLHGIGEYAGRYERLAQVLGEAKIALLGMDLRGHGRSFGPRGHCAPREEILKDIDELVEYAEIRYPGVPRVLYGHSMGGNIALDYRARGLYNGVLSSYIISAPWLLLQRKVGRPLVLAMKGLARVAPSKSMSTGVDAGDLGNPESVGPYLGDPLVHERISFLCALEGHTIGEALAHGTHLDDGGSKGIPTLLMHGSADRLCRVEGSRLLAARDEDISYVEWEGYYHEIHNGNDEKNGDEVLAAMVDFLI